MPGDYFRPKHALVTKKPKGTNRTPCQMGPSHVAVGSRDNLQKGDSHYVPDALSRSLDVSEEIVSFSEIKDEWYLKRKSEVANRPEKCPTWKIEDGMLYRYMRDAVLDPVTDGELSWKLVVPAKQRERLLDDSHRIASAGHLGGREDLRPVSPRVLLARNLA